MISSKALSLLCGSLLIAASKADDPPCERISPELPNVLWLLIDDVSAERFPDFGNEALEGMLPGIDAMKADGGVYYEHFYTHASICSPSQVGLFSSQESSMVGGQYQFTSDIYPGKESYRTVPAPEVMFMPEQLRPLGYYSIGGGKLDYQVAEVVPTFYDAIVGGAFSDIHPFMNMVWDPTLDPDSEVCGRPWFGMVNMMDVHQQFSAFTSDSPIEITVPYSDGEYYDTDVLPFGRYGYTDVEKLIFDIDGTPTGAAPITQNLLATDIIGYEGDFDETTLSHENGGVPGYLPDEIGIRSVLSREYDLIRNMDFRVKTIVDTLKEKGIYDNTAIFLFGDHGSGTHKGKFMLQPQSLRPPLWVKYPKDMDPSPFWEEADLGFVDRRMSQIIDLYPTVMSIVGQEPDDWMNGVALAGEFEWMEERDVLFGISQRLAAARAWKSFAAWSKDFFYQQHLMTTTTIEERQEFLAGMELEALSDSILRTSRYAGPYDIFAVSPLYDRVRRLMYVNIQDGWDPAWYGLAADGQRPPPELLYDFRSDPYGTNNLIVEYTYSVGISDEVQEWGNNVANVTVEYGDVDTSGLDDEQLAAYNMLKDAIPVWIEGQRWATPDIDWSEDFWGEENKMARIMWPDTPVQPTTNVAHFSQIVPTGQGVSNVVLNSPTPGTVFRYSVVTPERRDECETIGVDVKDSIPTMSIINSGIPQEESYTSQRSGVTYEGGFLYGVGAGMPERVLTVLTPLGSNPQCNLYVSADGTFMEFKCVNRSPFVFDTRDATWDGTTWVGVDEETGEWTGEPLTFVDPVTQGWNEAAFEAYVFGPDRNEIYSGLNADGTTFVTTSRNQLPLNRGYNPAPSYWAVPGTDVFQNPTRFVDEIWITKGWEVNFEDRRTTFESGTNIGQHKKGSFEFIFNQRRLSPPAVVENELIYDSYNYECLKWEVGPNVVLDFLGQGSDTLHIFSQGIRKGYRDSEIVEVVFTRPETNICPPDKKYNPRKMTCKTKCRKRKGVVYDPVTMDCVPL